MKKEGVLSLILKGEKFRYLKARKSKKGDAYLIFAPDHIQDGTHISSHASGILNMRNKDRSIDFYNFKDVFAECVKEALKESLVPISKAEKVYVIPNLPKELEDKMTTEVGNETIVDFDIALAYLKKRRKIYTIKNENPSEIIDKFPESTIQFTDKKEKKNFAYFKGIPDKLVDRAKLLKILDKKLTERGFVLKDDKKVIE